MTWFDYGVIAVLAVSLLIGLIHGLAREIVSLIGWVAAFVLATAFGPEMAGLMPHSLGPLLGGLLGYGVAFVGILLVSGLIGLILSLLLRAAGLGLADRSLGAVFGLGRGAVIILVLVLLGGLTPLPREPFWRDAALSGPLETAALALRPYLPDGVGQKLKYR